MTHPESPVPAWMITTAPELHGYRVVSSFGVVMGLAISRGAFLDSWEDVAAGVREKAMERMAVSAAARGATAVIAMHYDSVENTNGIIEVVAYGTAVVVEPLGR